MNLNIDMSKSCVIQHISRIKTKTILYAVAAFDKISIQDNSLEETRNRIISQCNKGMYDKLPSVIQKDEGISKSGI